MNKTKFWFKLEKDFFQKPFVKKLRSIAGGEIYILIYLKLKLYSLEKGGRIVYSGIGDSFLDELSFSIDEEEINIKNTLMFLKNIKMVDLEETLIRFTDSFSSFPREITHYKRINQEGQPENQLPENKTQPDPESFVASYLQGLGFEAKIIASTMAVVKQKIASGATIVSMLDYAKGIAKRKKEKEKPKKEGQSLEEVEEYLKTEGYKDSVVMAVIKAIKAQLTKGIQIKSMLDYAQAIAKTIVANKY